MVSEAIRIKFDSRGLVPTVLQDANTGEVLMVRVGPEAYEAALAEAHCRECDFTGRPLKGLVMIDPKGSNSDGDLKAWVHRGVGFASSLPAK